MQKGDLIMTQKKQQVDIDEVFQKIASGAPVHVKRGKKQFNIQDTASHHVKAESLKRAFAYLYATLHLDGIEKIDVMVYNPNPSTPEGDYVFPADMFLIKESHTLKILKCANFLNYCEELVTKRNVPCIGGVIGLNPEDTWRLSVTVSPNATDDTDVDVSFSVSGENREKNYQKLHQLIKRIEEYQQRCYEHSA